MATSYWSFGHPGCAGEVCMVCADQMTPESWRQVCCKRRVCHAWMHSKGIFKERLISNLLGTPTPTTPTTPFLFLTSRQRKSDRACRRFGMLNWPATSSNHHASAGGVRVEMNSGADSKEYARRVKHFMVPCSHQWSHFSEVVGSGAG